MSPAHQARASFGKVMLAASATHHLVGASCGIFCALRGFHGIWSRLKSSTLGGSFKVYTQGTGGSDVYKFCSFRVYTSIDSI